MARWTVKGREARTEDDRRVAMQQIDMTKRMEKKEAKGDVSSYFVCSVSEIH